MNIQEFLQANRKEIFEFIESQQRAIPNSNDIFVGLLNYLKAVMPMSHGNIDKTHHELATAILEVFWLACLSQMKENRAAYSTGSTDCIKKAIYDAFETGKVYAPEEESRRASLG
jgi:tetrahydrodipicolinate N-succinyltransferase